MEVFVPCNGLVDELEPFVLVGPVDHLLLELDDLVNSALCDERGTLDLVLFEQLPIEIDHLEPRGSGSPHLLLDLSHFDHPVGISLSLVHFDGSRPGNEQNSLKYDSEESGKRHEPPAIVGRGTDVSVANSRHGHDTVVESLTNALDVEHPHLQVSQANHQKYKRVDHEDNSAPDGMVSMDLPYFVDELETHSTDLIDSPQFHELDKLQIYEDSDEEPNPKADHDQVEKVVDQAMVATQLGHAFSSPRVIEE